LGEAAPANAAALDAKSVEAAPPADVAVLAVASPGNGISDSQLLRDRETVEAEAARKSEPSPKRAEVLGQPQPSSTAAGFGGNFEKLRCLRKWRQDGLVDSPEFKAAKRELLATM
jgi:hypothetical protein